LNRVGVHVQVREYILRLIRSGILAEGAPVETEESLTSRFGVSRRSVRAALQELVDQKYLYKIQGKGTFVTRAELRLDLNAQRPSKTKILLALDEEETCDQITSYHRDFIGGIAYAASLKGHQLVYAPPKRDAALLLELYQAEGCGGIIWLRADKRFHPAIGELASKGVPQVAINRTVPGIPSVSTDEESAFSEIVDFLKGIGHKRIAFLNVDSEESIYRTRSKLFADFMKKAGAKKDDCVVIEAGIKALIPALESAFHKPNQPTALVLGGHGILVHSLPWLSSLRIPEDVSVLCFNDSAEAMTFKVPLSVFSDPRNEIGRKAVELLELAIAGKAMNGERWLVKGDLIARRSCSIPKHLKRDFPG